MFEQLQQRRQSHRQYWGRALGIGTAVLVAAVVLVRCQLRQAEERRIEESRAAFREDPTWNDEGRRYTRVDLPGMSIEVPGEGERQGDADAGAYGGSRPLEFALSWKRREYPGDELRQQMFGQLANVMQREAQLTAPLLELSRRDVRFGTRGEQVFYSSGMMMASVTVGECGGRMLILLVAGHDVDAATTRMIESFRCAPDAAVR